MTSFRKLAEERAGQTMCDYDALWTWSVENPAEFWSAIWDFFAVRASRPWDVALENPDSMLEARWFTGARLNYAENILRRRDGDDAIICWCENGSRRTLTFSELYEAVSGFSVWLRRQGVERGDRVAGFLPNLPETIVAMLATASIGATWSSCSPDFGTSGVLSRFGQISPKVLVCADGYFYGGREFNSLDRVASILEELPSVRSVAVVPYLSDEPELSDVPIAVNWTVAISQPEQDIAFEQVPFDHPLVIMYSSGTTGAPKCIVHGHGGTLLQHLKEHALHCDHGPVDRMLYFSTCGWMMWNWQVSGLALGTTLLIYEGNPAWPTPAILWDFCEQEKMTVFGASAKYYAAIEKAGVKPCDTHDLSKLRLIMSTGSPLAPESFSYVYRDIKDDVQLSSISGGTDIISCFALGNPVLPVHIGELQCRGLGMSVEIFDDDGVPCPVGTTGELVCTRPFPSMPVEFWNDPDGSTYRAAYFNVYENVWRHGDWSLLTASGGLIIQGRSDAVLNPGGVRIGTAEIYREVEMFDDVLESLCIGQDWDGDTRIVLFVVMRPGMALTTARSDEIRKKIRASLTPRHVPAVIIEVADIPRTRSNKISELAVRNIVHGRPVVNTDALLNPEALELFRNLPKLVPDA